MRAVLPILFLAVARAVLASEPVGEPFAINELTAGNQFAVDVARQPNRSFIVVWQSEDADGDGYGIRMRRFSRNGTALTGELAVNEFTVGWQSRPRVAADGNGDFVVVWDGPGQDSRDIFARLFAADGSALGSEAQVNTIGTAGLQSRPAVSRNAAGQFVISWVDAASGQVLAAVFDAAGNATVSEFVVTTSGDSPPVGEVATGIYPWGEFVVVWIGLHDAMGGSSYHEVFQRRYDSLGQPLGPELPVSSLEPTGGPLTLANQPSVMLNNGGFVVVWDDHPTAAWEGVYARRVDADGSMGLIKTVSPQAASNKVSMATSGEFVISWSQYDYYNVSPAAASFDPAINLIESLTIPGGGRPMALEHLGSDVDDFMLVRQLPQYAELFGQRFGPNLFADGFESGDTSEWQP